MDYFLDVVLPIPLERLFTYKISQAEADYIEGGMRVAVPFGKSKEGLPLGVQLLSKHFDEQIIFNASLYLEKNND